MEADLAVKIRWLGRFFSKKVVWENTAQASPVLCNREPTQPFKMKKRLFQLLFLGIARCAFSQGNDPVFHPIDAKRPEKSYFQHEIQRLQMRNMEAFLLFAASEFALSESARVAVLLNGSFVGTLDAAGHFTQIVDEKKLLDIPLDSVQMVLSGYDPAFRTRHSTANFFGKTDVLAVPVKLPDTVAWNRFEPERFVINRQIFKSEYQELAAVAVRAGWFLGSITRITAFQAGAWLEIPLTRKMALQTEFSYTNKRDSLGRFVKTPFENFDYSLNEWKGRIELKYYLRSRYQRPFLFAGGYVGRAKGHLVGERGITPVEFLGPKTAFGLRFGFGYQFFSGFYGAFSISPRSLHFGEFLPAQKLKGATISFGWMIGQP